MTINNLGITSETLPYQALRSRYRQGLEWLIKCIGASSDIHDGQIEFYNLKPDIAREGNNLRSLLITNLSESQTPSEQAHDYFTGVCSLVSPWQKMFISPPFHRFNRQVSRFAAAYDAPSFFPMTRFEKLIKLMIDSIKLQLDQKEKEHKKNNLPHHSDDNFFNDLGSEMDMSPEAVKERNDRILANHERRQLRVAKPFKDELAIMAVLQNADPSYVLAILSSNEVGVKHKDDSVRMGALNIVQSLAGSVLPSLEKQILSDFSIIGMSKNEVQLDLIDDAVSILSSISRIVNSKNYCMNDTNRFIKSKSEDVDKFVIEAAIKLVELKKDLLH